MKQCLVTARDANCHEKATHLVIFIDGDKAPACHDCALYLELQAQSNGTSVKVEVICAQPIR